MESTSFSLPVLAHGTFLQLLSIPVFMVSLSHDIGRYNLYFVLHEVALLARGRVGSMLGSRKEGSEMVEKKQE